MPATVTKCECGNCWDCMMQPCDHGVSAMDAYYHGCPQCNAEAEALVAACEAMGGHQLVDDSYAGPDSGNVSVYCTRCPYAHSKQLY